MKKIALIVLMATTVFFVGCNSRGSSGNFARPKTAEELRQELKTKEQSNLYDYLSVEYKLDYKLLAGKDVIKGVIKNKASIAKFKDVVLTITFFTETDTELKTQDVPIYKFVGPNSSTEFELNLTPPPGRKKIRVKIKNATPVD